MKTKFNKEIYNKKAIKGAMKAYEEVADLDMTENDNYFEVDFKKIKPKFKDIIKDEFSNYALILMQ